MTLFACLSIYSVGHCKRREWRAWRRPFYRSVTLLDAEPPETNRSFLVAKFCSLVSFVVCCLNTDRFFCFQRRFKHRVFFLCDSVFVDDCVTQSRCAPDVWMTNQRTSRLPADRTDVLCARWCCFCGGCCSLSICLLLVAVRN